MCGLDSAGCNISRIMNIAAVLSRRSEDSGQPAAPSRGRNRSHLPGVIRCRHREASGDAVQPVVYSQTTDSQSRLVQSEGRPFTRTTMARQRTRRLVSPASSAFPAWLLKNRCGTAYSTRHQVGFPRAGRTITRFCDIAVACSGLRRDSPLRLQSCLCIFS